MRQSAILATALVLAGCGDQPAPAEPALAQPVDDAVRTAPLVEAAPLVPGTHAPGLPDGLRAGMTRALTAALVELELEPDLPMSALQSFFHQVEAQQAERLRAADDLSRAVQP